MRQLSIFILFESALNGMQLHIGNDSQAKAICAGEVINDE